ncbi:MAG TPA: OadG family protein [Bryobacteraceae bacterium]|nr:OadG family protein [Bryobacteraceae bacterium]HOQ45743.1 OadG family protein [Bryobacteraceae bacterium]HPQ16095.1 OadG family protein [Bryobacteraceae bacterium]HPU71530.1 OadG family protein [Bryobacteraceae bacterium]
MEQKTNRTRTMPAALLGSAAGALAALFLARRKTAEPRIKAHPRRAPAIAPAAPVEETAPPVEENSEEISPEVLAVISAAVAAYLGKPARVRSVRQLQTTPSLWAQAGRVSIQGSHQIRL